MSQFKTPSKLTIPPIGDVGDVARSPASPRTPASPKTPTSRADALEFLYGAPINQFVPGRKPTKIEIVQLYMYYFDQVSPKEVLLLVHIYFDLLSFDDSHL